MNLKVLLKDLKDQSSHSVDYLLSSKVEDTLSKKGIKIRKLFTPIVRFIFSYKTKYKLKVHKRTKLKKTEKGRIYVINHRQGDDIVLASKTIKDSGYIVFGNRYLALDTINGLGLWAHGMILFDRDDKESRKAVIDKAEYLIENGGNVIIFAEGYWNLDDDGQKDEQHSADAHNSETWFIQDFNIGLFKLAQKLGCEIVPGVLHYDETRGKKRCYSQVGRAVTIGEDEDVFAKKDEILDYARTMYYELMERYSEYPREYLEKKGLSSRQKRKLLRHCKTDSEKMKIKNGVPLKKQWELLKEELVRDCDIPRTGYRLDLADEKRIGKAKVAKPVVTIGDVYENDCPEIPEDELGQYELYQSRCALLRTLRGILTECEQQSQVSSDNSPRQITEESIAKVLKIGERTEF